MGETEVLQAHALPVFLENSNGRMAIMIVKIAVQVEFSIIESDP
jgi:hypothetical protein